MLIRCLIDVVNKIEKQHWFRYNLIQHWTIGQDLCQWQLPKETWTNGKFDSKASSMASLAKKNSTRWSNFDGDHIISHSKMPASAGEKLNPRRNCLRCLQWRKASKGYY